MHFVLILILIFLAYIWLWPLVRLWLVRRAQRQMADFFGFRGYPSGGPEPEPQRRPRTPHKKIDPSVGEYVDFEEFASHSSESYTQSAVSYTEEEQITDVEWEDLPPAPPSK